MACVRLGPGGKTGAGGAIVAKLKEDKEHPATKGSDDDLKKIVKWILARWAVPVNAKSRREPAF